MTAKPVCALGKLEKQSVISTLQIVENSDGFKEQKGRGACA